MTGSSTMMSGGKFNNKRSRKDLTKNNNKTNVLQ